MSSLNVSSLPITETSLHQAVQPPLIRTTSTTLRQVQQALDDACITHNWSAALKKIDVAMRRAQLHVVR